MLNKIKINQFRKHLGMTQSELGRKIGVRKQTIYKYERGIITNISIERLLLLAKVLKVSPYDLIEIHKGETP